ncbi:13390_t:CDS:2, partial [Gigaspora margarita]
HIEGETVTLAVVIVQTSYTKGSIFEVDLVEMLKSIGGKVIHKGKKLKAHHGDHYGSQHSFFLVSGVPEMLRHWEFMMNRIHSNIESTVVDYSACATSLQPKGTIGIIVGPSMDSFTSGAIDAALEIAELLEPSEPELLEQLLPYPIIVTDVDRLPKYLINAVLNKLHNEPYTFFPLS